MKSGQLVDTLLDELVLTVRRDDARKLRELAEFSSVSVIIGTLNQAADMLDPDVNDG